MSKVPYTLGLVNPYRLAEAQETLEGECAVTHMSRAMKLLANDEGLIKYRLNFAKDSEQRCLITGEVGMEVLLKCQRCLQTFGYTATTEIAVCPVQDDKAAKTLPKEYDPIMLSDGKINLFDLLEDELILALPQVAMHDLSEVQKLQCREISNDEEVQGLSNPFQILQTLKVDRNGPEVDDHDQ